MKTEKKTIEELAVITSIIALTTILAFNLNQSTLDINKITGNAISRANISALRELPCNFTLESGLNLVSFFCITYDTNRSIVIGNITQLQAIFEYQESSFDKWKVYNPNLPSWVFQDLNTMSRTEGYYIIMNSTEEVFIPGGLRVPTNINLIQGWNLAGYPTNETKNTNETAFTSITGNYTEVRGLNPITKAYLSFIPPDSGGLRQTTPYKGYWINSTTAEVWIVD